MKLKDFVTQTLLNITEGVEKARDKSTIAIAPSSTDGEIIKTPQYVSFEIAVSVSKEGGAGINVLPLGVNGKFSSGNQHKVSFQVPIYFSHKWTNR